MNEFHPYRILPNNGGFTLERIKEMKTSIQGYQASRVKIKKEYLTQYKTKIESEFQEKLEMLVCEQLNNQTESDDRKLSRLYMCRLKSSEYTGSYQSILGLSCSQLYLDDHRSQLYWRPPYLYDSLKEDVEEVKKIYERILFE